MQKTHGLSHYFMNGVKLLPTAMYGLRILSNQFEPNT